MTYYKIIVNSEIIGVATSNNCFCYQPAHYMLERTTALLAEYLECNSRLYHALWMQPIKTDSYLYEIADIIAIGEQEYNILVPAVETAPVPVETEEPENAIEEPTNPTDEITLEFVRTSKIAEMSTACRTTIEAGFDLQLRGETHHFSLDTQDQLNLISLSAMAQTQELIPYHADGESCIFYTAEEIQQIVATATSFKIYHTTYHNALKAYVNSLETLEDIAAVTYGMEIPEEFQTDVLKTLM